MIILTIIAIITAIVMQERTQVITHTVIAIAMQARIQVITHTVIAIVTVIAMQARTQAKTHIATVTAMQARMQAKIHIVTAIVILTITRINRNVTIDSVKKKYINNAEIAHMVWKPYGFSSYNIVKM